MKNLYITTIFLFVQIIAFAQIGGSLDPTFATNGTHLLDISQLQGGIVANDMKVLPNNKIVYGGYTVGGGNIHMAIIALNADGTLDNSFGNNGVGLYDPTLGGTNTILGITAQPDGKILATGRTAVGQNSKLFVGRFLADGNFDPTFGGGMGFVEYPSFTGKKMAVDNGGRIVVLGYIVNNGQGFTTLYRLNADGTKDNTFSGDGYLEFHFPADLQINGDEENLAIAPDNSIYVVGKDYANHGIVCKITPNGVLDNSFSGDGKVVIAHQLGGEIQGNDIACAADGKVWVLCTSIENGENSVMLTKLNTNGTLDNSFGNQGLAYISAAGESFSSARIRHNQNGIYIVGNHYANSTGFVFTANFTPAGVLNTSYGNNGIALVDPDPNTGNYANSIDFQSDGKVMIGCYGSEDNKFYPWVSRLNKAGFMSILENELLGITIYPNPTSEAFQIKTEKNENIGKVSLINMSGQEVQTWNNAQGQYHVSQNLSNGMYTLRIQIGTVISHQLINVNR